MALDSPGNCDALPYGRGSVGSMATGRAGRRHELLRTEGFLMPTVNEGYVVDENGARVGVILPMEKYRKLLEELEELESIRAYDAAKNAGDKAIPFEQAVEEIERDGR